MKKPNFVIYIALTVYFTAMLMLVSYLIYAKFSPLHQELYTPTSSNDTQPTINSASTSCQTNDDCLIDSCHACQAINKNALIKPQVCLVNCPFQAVCLDGICSKLPQ